MRIAELSMEAGYSTDQARRRLNGFVEEGVVERKRQTEWPYAWEYSPEILELLRDLRRHEDAGCTCKDAIPIVAAQHRSGPCRFGSDDPCNESPSCCVTVVIELGATPKSTIPKAFESVAINSQGAGKTLAVDQINSSLPGR
jgi:hypothetical protein